MFSKTNIRRRRKMKNENFDSPNLKLVISKFYFVNKNLIFTKNNIQNK